MMLTKLKAAAAALVLGIVAAGAVVSAQQAAGGQGENSAPVPTTRRPPQAAPAGGGHLIVDWIPADSQGGKREIIVDPKRHSVHLPHGPTSLKRDDRLNDGMIHLDLERGKTYTVTASGEAFLSAQTGNDADPFAGVVVIYSTDEEDCFAERQIVLAPGKSITFKSPWLIDPKSEGYVKAFFLDTWPGHPKRGTYTLTVTESGEWADSKHARIYKAREDRRWDDAMSRLILKQAGESDTAFVKRALEAARKPGGDPEVPASPAREAPTGLPANSKP